MLPRDGMNLSIDHGALGDMREVVVKFNVEPDNDANLSFLTALQGAWERFIAGPGESYEVLSDTAAPSRNRLLPEDYLRTEENT